MFFGTIPNGEVICEKMMALAGKDKKATANGTASASNTRTWKTEWFTVQFAEHELAKIRDGQFDKAS